MTSPNATFTTSPLPLHFLSRSNRHIHKTLIDFSLTPCSSYAGHYAAILDDAFSTHECAILSAHASSTSPSGWLPAKINRGTGKDEELNTDRRKCERVIVDDRELAERIWARVGDHVPELKEIVGRAEVTGPGPVKRGEKWRVSRLNERMRFLRYGKGEYFRKHCDGTYETPDKTERSMFTLHLYLNEVTPENPLAGGATTFHDLCTCKKSRWDICDCQTGSFDVEPKIGRILIFQQRGLEHSGAEVSEGIKMTMRSDLLYSKVVE